VPTSHRSNRKMDLLRQNRKLIETIHHSFSPFHYVQYFARACLMFLTRKGTAFFVNGV
jgi:hypothetical protein